jgi:hypothetical protein
MTLVMDLPAARGSGTYEVYLLRSGHLPPPPPPTPVIQNVFTKCTLYYSPHFMAANPLQGPLEGVGPENRDKQLFVQNDLEINRDMYSKVYRLPHPNIKTTNFLHQ